MSESQRDSRFSDGQKFGALGSLFDSPGIAEAPPPPPKLESPSSRRHVRDSEKLPGNITQGVKKVRRKVNRGAASSTDNTVKEPPPRPQTSFFEEDADSAQSLAAQPYMASIQEEVDDKNFIKSLFEEHRAAVRRVLSEDLERSVDSIMQQAMRLHMAAMQRGGANVSSLREAIVEADAFPQKPSNEAHEHSKRQGAREPEYQSPVQSRGPLQFAPNDKESIHNDYIIADSDSPRAFATKAKTNPAVAVPRDSAISAISCANESPWSTTLSWQQQGSKETQNRRNHKELRNQFANWGPLAGLPKMGKSVLAIEADPSKDLQEVPEEVPNLEKSKTVEFVDQSAEECGMLDESPGSHLTGKKVKKRRNRGSLEVFNYMMASSPSGANSSGAKKSQSPEDWKKGKAQRKKKSRLGAMFALIFGWCKSKADRSSDSANDGSGSERVDVSWSNWFDEGEDRGQYISATAFPDSESMKAQVREQLVEEAYDVSMLYKKTGWCQRIARSQLFESVTLSVIAFASAWIAVDVDLNKSTSMLDAHPVFVVADNFFCLYFFLEWGVRLGAFKSKISGLHDFWFVFDTFLAWAMVADTWVLTIVVASIGQEKGKSSLGNSSILKGVRLVRLVRMTRMIRLLNSFPELMVVIKGMGVAARAVVSTLILMSIIIYVFAVLLRQLTDESDLGDKRFPNVPITMRFLLLTGTVPDLEPYTNEIWAENFIFAIIYMGFALIVSITVMNMLVGVLVGVVNTVAVVEKEQLMVEFVKATILRTLNNLDSAGDRNGMISKPEFDLLIRDPTAVKSFNQMGVDVAGLMDLAEYIFDEGRELAFPAFMELCMELRGTNHATVKDIVDLRKFILLEICRAQDEIENEVKADLGEVYQGLAHGMSQRPGGSKAAVAPPAFIAVSRPSSDLSRKIQGKSSPLAMLSSMKGSSDHLQQVQKPAKQTSAAPGDFYKGQSSLSPSSRGNKVEVGGAASFEAPSHLDPRHLDHGGSGSCMRISENEEPPEEEDTSEDDRKPDHQDLKTQRKKKVTKKVRN